MSTKSSRSDEPVDTKVINIPDFIHLYVHDPSIDKDGIKAYLAEKLEGISQLDFRGNFFQHHVDLKELDLVAKALVSTKVFDASDPTKVYDPFPVEISHERRLIEDPQKNFSGNLYDGFRLQRFLRTLLPSEESSFAHLHIIITGRPIGTWDRGDGRYHARTCVLGFPCVVSLWGIVEAPAKPKEFYIIRKALVASGMARELVEEQLKKRFEGSFVDHGDPLLTEILKGYIMQAFFYHVTFEAFCDDKSCRLFNAHWQADMMNAQLKGEDFCGRHEGLLEKIKSALK